MEHGERNEIVSATDASLTLRVAGREVLAPWSTVTGVSAGRAKRDRTSTDWILILAVEMQLPDREHLFLVGEIEPAWIPLTTNLHIALPDIAPFDVWGAELMTASAPMELYQRATQA